MNCVLVGHCLDDLVADAEAVGLPFLSGFDWHVERDRVSPFRKLRFPGGNCAGVRPVTDVGDIVALALDPDAAPQCGLFRS